MSTTIDKKNSDTKKIALTLFILAIVAIIALALTGCSTPKADAADPKASAASSPEQTPASDADNGISKLGDTVTYKDGISLSVSAPAPYTPSDMSAGLVDGQSAVAIEFVLTNNSKKAFDPTLVMATASSGGTEAAGVFDVSNQIGFPPQTSILPGSTIKWTQAFSVADPADITLEVQAGFTHDATIFTNK